MNGLWGITASPTFAQNPYHLYAVASAYPYTVTLKVTDDTGKVGLLQRKLL